ncbi:hypothetical protein SAMCFNEI73_Ch1053 [Sinorhizobium americanum]|uniref:Uncharacterized protein n=1 Tax=Sinorhizobium americanum TaxID=194963 RepID=A0A1L3LJT8_9HYPH|nr:hypothetical protein SAMCFNEI73_Ch1053 [Sinorhizobium americanum]
MRRYGIHHTLAALPRKYRPPFPDKSTRAIRFSRASGYWELLPPC